MNKKRITNIIKILLFASMLILTYFISEKFIDYIVTVEIETLKRALNIILAIIITILYMKGGKKNERKQENIERNDRHTSKANKK